MKKENEKNQRASLSRHDHIDRASIEKKTKRFESNSKKRIEMKTPADLKKIRMPFTGTSLRRMKSMPEIAEKDSAAVIKKRKKAKELISKINIKPNREQSRQDHSDISVEDESEVEDQTEALLSGFQSDEVVNDIQTKEGTVLNQEQCLLKKKAESLNITQNEKSTIDSRDKPGVLYVGRIPHGFYEHQMRSFFKQFGTVLKLRLSRNKKTGASKHHAWIKFESAVVAEIVAKTMDNHLMFGHLLKVKLVSDDQIPKDLFKGANRRFKKVPWNKIEGRKLSQPLTREAWQRRIIKEQKRRLEKAAHLKELGYEFELPKIESVDQISTCKAVD